MITPDEFVRAGDHLVYHCPTWSWAAGEQGRRKAYLPPDKQFLVTKNGTPTLSGTEFSRSPPPSLPSSTVLQAVPPGGCLAPQ